MVKEAFIHESSVYKYLIEDATRVQIDRSVDFLKHDPNQKDTFSSGVTILKVREALKELYILILMSFESKVNHYSVEIKL